MVSGNFSDALEDFGKAIINEEVKIQPEELEEWETIYGSIRNARRKTMGERIVDEMSGQSLTSSLKDLIYLFNGNFTQSFAKRTDETLVRRVADPIVKNAGAEEIDWLAKVVDIDKQFWNAADENDQDTFKASLQNRVKDEASENQQNLKQIADKLGIKIPKEKNNDESNNADSK